jgi:hypothetical protein
MEVTDIVRGSSVSLIGDASIVEQVSHASSTTFRTDPKHPFHRASFVGVEKGMTTLQFVVDMRLPRGNAAITKAIFPLVLFLSHHLTLLNVIVRLGTFHMCDIQRICWNNSLRRPWKWGFAMERDAIWEREGPTLNARIDKCLGLVDPIAPPEIKVMIMNLKDVMKISFKSWMSAEWEHYASLRPTMSFETAVVPVMLYTALGTSLVLLWDQPPAPWYASILGFIFSALLSTTYVVWYRVLPINRLGALLVQNAKARQMQPGHYTTIPQNPVSKAQKCKCKEGLYDLVCALQSQVQSFTTILMVAFTKLLLLTNLLIPILLGYEDPDSIEAT